eukprot:7413098-Ditylum_brightwellii.AAC.1
MMTFVSPDEATTASCGGVCSLVCMQRKFQWTQVMQGDHTYYKTKITPQWQCSWAILQETSYQDLVQEVSKAYCLQDIKTVMIFLLPYQIHIQGKVKGREGQIRTMLSPGGKYCHSYNMNSCLECKKNNKNKTTN